MQDSTHLMVLFASVLVIVIGLKLSGGHRNTLASRLFIAGGMMLGGFLMALGCVLTTQLGTMPEFFLNFFSVLFVVLGIASLIPPPHGATKLNQHALLGNVIACIGLAMGFAHTIAFEHVPWWQEHVLGFFRSLGVGV